MAAEIADSDVEVGPDEVVVERKIVPAHRRGTSLLAVILLLDFVATCVFAFEAAWRELRLTPSASNP